MTQQPTVDARSVFLFAAPWLKASWPALGIATLHGYLEARDVKTTSDHFHLEAAVAVGWSRYDLIAEMWGVGEALFGALLQPDDTDRLLREAHDQLVGQGDNALADWVRDEGCRTLHEVTMRWLDRTKPERFDLVGGSISVMQLCSTLYALQHIEQRGHTGLRVLGGPGVVGPVARAVMDRCPLVDAVVDGEGEKALLGLATQASAPHGIPGVWSRDAEGTTISGGRMEVIALDTSPTPVLGAYFESATTLRVPATSLTLPFEHSRGCEWEQRTPGKLRGCTFCGLYRTSPNHRQKDAPRVLEEVAQTVNRYRVLNVAFVDAYIPKAVEAELVNGLNALPGDLTYFTEMRCDITREVAARLATRCNRVQLGVESFTSPILKRISKGVTGANTVYSVRVLQEHGISTQYNLMLRIPGVPVQEIEELAELLPTLYGLRPPNIADFYLDRNSRIFASPLDHGLDPDQIDHERHAWLPTSLGDSRISQVVPFAHPDDAQESAWRDVERRVEEWRTCWGRAQHAGVAAPLTWRDGSGWASIVDLRTGTARFFTVDGPLYDVLRTLREVHSTSQLAAALPQHSEDTLREAIDVLKRNRLILEDRKTLLATAIHTDARVPASA